MCCLSAPSPQAIEKAENLRFKILAWVPLFLQHTQVLSSVGHVEPSPCSPGEILALTGVRTPLGL